MWILTLLVYKLQSLFFRFLWSSKLEFDISYHNIKKLQTWSMFSYYSRWRENIEYFRVNRICSSTMMRNFFLDFDSYWTFLREKTQFSRTFNHLEHIPFGYWCKIPHIICRKINKFQCIFPIVHAIVHFILNILIRIIIIFTIIIIRMLKGGIYSHLSISQF